MVVEKDLLQRTLNKMSMNVISEVHKKSKLTHRIDATVKLDFLGPAIMNIPKFFIGCRRKGSQVKPFDGEEVSEGSGG